MPAEAYEPDRAQLVELAGKMGVATDYWDWRGNHVEVSSASIRAVLAALGKDTATHAALHRSLTDAYHDPWRRLLPPCVVTVEGVAADVAVHVPHGDPITLWLELEDGSRRDDVTHVDRWVDPWVVDGAWVGEATVRLPDDLPLGYHTLHGVSPTRQGAAAIMVTPAWVGLPAEWDDGDRGWGVMLQLYATRSRSSWGVGDLGDLGAVCAWAGDLGADFALVNPLHAAEPVPPLTASPYLPSTRRFLHPIYLWVEALPEYTELGDAAKSRARRAAEPLQLASRGADLIDRDSAWAVKLAVLEELAALPLAPPRRAAYDDFCAREGEGLEAFALWCALTEEQGEGPLPDEVAGPHAAGIAAARVRLADRVDLFRKLQWWVDEQLASAQRAARQSGMRLGVMHDLAVGVHPHGADAWSLGPALARGCSVGAPPDAFNQLGQDWSQPPWRPDQLAEQAYRPYRDMLRTVLRHSGGIRVDHIIGLFRLWWVPAGQPPTQGTYVRYDHEALIGVLALEAARAGAVVVGEDLGTVEPWSRDYLRDRGILGTSVLWFERGDSGEPHPPEQWREYCLATVTTHDLPPSAGYLDGEHLVIRERLGLLTRSTEEEEAAFHAEQAAFAKALDGCGIEPAGPDLRSRVVALHRFLGRTPSRLVGVSLGDMVGDRRAVNQPGTDKEYPNWRVPMTDGEGRPVLIDELPSLTLPRALALAVREG